MNPSIPMDKEKVCQICGQVNKTQGKHYYHYGAIACYGCKSFFRRTTNKKSYLKFTCVNGTPCPTYDYAQWHRCSKCRYKKCLEVGMNPKLVLSYNQRVTLYGARAIMYKVEPSNK